MENLYNTAFLSVLFGAAWVLLIFAGHWFKRGRNREAEFLCPNATKSLQGLAAAGVLCHHLSQTPAYQTLNQIPLFLETGFLCVAVFFFCSGYGLVKSLNTRPGYLKGFLPRRLCAVIVPYYVMNLFYIAYHIVIKTQMSAGEWFCKVTGIALLNDNAWFVPVIAIMYASFYLIFGSEKSVALEKSVASEKSVEAGIPDAQAARRERLLSFILIFLVIALQVGWFLFNKHFPWWLGKKDWWRVRGALSGGPWYMMPTALWYEGEWWVNSTIAFLLGMVVAQHHKKFYAFFLRGYWIKLLCSAILFALSMRLFFYAENTCGLSYWMEFGGNNKTLPRAILMGINALQSLSFCLLLALILMRDFSENRATRFLGNHSLELYLMQALPIRGFQKVFGIEGYFGQKIEVSMTTTVLYTLCAVAGSLVLAVLLKFLSGLILKRLNSCKKAES